MPRAPRSRRIATATGLAGVGLCLVAALGISGAHGLGWTWDDDEDALPIERTMPSLGGAISWLNSPPLTAAELRGKVVIVQFWTFSCINWLRTLPYIRAWETQYASRGLVVFGVHSPEFSFEHDPAQVRRATTAMAIGYPVAIDSDHAIWGAFHNAYWPALYIVDARGRIRYEHFGEGDYEQSEQVIRQLLGVGPREPFASVDARGVEATADWASLGSTETYVGYEHADGFASPGGILRDEGHAYVLPSELLRDHWALSGTWTLGGEAAALDTAGGKITYRFHARDLHVVMGAKDEHSPVRFRVRIDGARPGNAHGLDIDEQGNGTAIEPRLYQLIRQSAPVRDRQIEIEFLDPEVEIYSFTFG